MAEPEPGRGKGSRAAGVTAGFKVDVTSLKELNRQFELLIRNVKTFNVELKKIDGGALDRLAVGAGGGGRVGSGSMLNAGGFSTPPGGGPSWTRSNGGVIYPGPSFNGGGGAPAGGGGAGGGTGGSSNGTGQAGGIKGWYAGLNPGWKIGGAALIGVGAAASSQRDTWRDSERLAQLTMWQTNGGNASSTMGQARHFWAGGNGQQGLTGYANQQDLMSGLQTLRDRQGLSMNSRSQQLQQMAGRAGNMLGSFDQGAQATADFQSPQSYYNLMSLGIKTMQGGKPVDSMQISDQILRAANGGRAMTTGQVASGRQEGTNLYSTLSSLGISGAMREQVLSYGEQRAKLGANASVQDVINANKKTGGAAGLLGDTLYDSDRLKAQEKARISQDMADTALPALRTAVDASTAAFHHLNGVLAGILGGVGGVVGPAAGAAQSFLGTAAGSMGAMWMMNRGRGGAPTPTPGGGAPTPVPFGAGARAFLGGAGGMSRAARGGLGGLAGYAAGSLASSVVPGQGTGSRVAKGALKYGAMGAGIGAFMGAGVFSAPGAAIGGGIGAALGGISGLFGGDGTSGSVEEVSAILNGLSAYGGITNKQDPSSPGAVAIGGSPSPAATGVPAGSTGSRGQQAIAWMERQHNSGSNSWLDACLKAVRMALGVPGGVSSAAVSFGMAKKRHGGTPPPGVPVWWTGGKYGHVALSAGNGEVWSNDILTKGHIDKVPIGLITSKWGKKYQGWSEDINGVDVYGNSVSSAPSSTTRSGGALSAAEVFKLARGAGFSRQAAITMTAIAGAESGYYPSAHNPNASTGDNSYGLWQINMLGSMGPERRKEFNLSSNDQLYDPRTNARAAWGLSGGGRSFMPWSTYKHGSHQKYLAGARQAAASLPSYDKGALDIYGDQLALVHHGEMVVPARDAGRVRDYVKAGASPDAALAATISGRTGGGVSVTLHMPVHVAAGTTQGDAKRLVSHVVRELETNQRLAAVMGGDN